MKIETKFGLGDTVWYIDESVDMGSPFKVKVNSFEITDINIKKDSKRNLFKI